MFSSLIVKLIHRRQEMTDVWESLTVARSVCQEMTGVWSSLMVTLAHQGSKYKRVRFVLLCAYVAVPAVGGCVNIIANGCAGNNTMRVGKMMIASHEACAR